MSLTVAPLLFVRADTVASVDALDESTIDVAHVTDGARHWLRVGGTDLSIAQAIALRCALTGGITVAARRAAR